MSDKQLSFLDIEEVASDIKIEDDIETKKETLHTEEIVPYEVGDFIRVNITITAEDDPESYYYLSQFEKKRGKVEEVIQNPRLQYRVLFGDKEVYLYHEEIL